MTGTSGRLRAAADAAAVRAAAVLLGAGCVIWAALPRVSQGYAGFALTAPTPSTLACGRSVAGEASDSARCVTSR